MISAEIKALWRSRWIILPANSAFGLENDSISQRRPFPQHPTENFFRSPAAIDVGMIEKIDANFFGGIEEGPRLLLVLRRQFRLDIEPPPQPHATHGEARFF